MKTTIIVADDEPKMRKLIVDYLHNAKYTTIEAENGVEVINEFNANKDEICLIILDVMMPLLDGFECCKSIRKTSNVPIIFLTAKTSENDEVLGLNLGGTDYITKPFSPKILIARINRIVKQYNEKNEVKILKAGNIIVNDSAHIVTVDDKEVYMSKMEYELLCYFIQNQGKILSREQIFVNVWGSDYFGNMRTIDTHVKLLRKKINNKYIRTVNKIGYIFNTI